MLHISGPSMDNIYHEMFELIRNNGVRANPRGKVCVELRPASFEIDSCLQTLYTGSSRKLNYRFWAAETLAYLAGWSGMRHAQTMVAVNKNMAAFVNPETEEFDGAYGKSFERSLVHVFNALQHDPETRQAVASIWDPGTLERHTGSRDVPCTVMLQFLTAPNGLVRDANFTNASYRLDLVVYMRSNDLNWGVPYDAPAFGCVQAVMARALGMEPGRYTHIDGSLHYYELASGQSEKPPVIRHRADETFHPILMPEWVGKREHWETVRDQAMFYCNCLWEQLVNEPRPFSEVNIYSEKYFNPFFSQMESMIRVGYFG